MRARRTEIFNLHGNRRQNRDSKITEKKMKKCGWCGEEEQMVHRRRRGTAIVDTPSGILVVSQSGRRYSLPGGGARFRESRRSAAVRELAEETGLRATDCSYLFEYNGRVHKDRKGGFFRDAHMVFLIKSNGVAKPRKEIKYLAYFNGSNVNVSETTRTIIETYHGKKNDNLVD